MVRRVTTKEVEALIEGKEVIGEGALGSIYAGEYLGAEVAVEVIRERTRLAALNNEENMLTRCVNVIKDFEHLSEIDHPNVVKVIALAEEEEFRVALVVERCTDGTLQDALSRPSEEVNAVLMLSYAVDIARGLAHMHGFNEDGELVRGEVLHRDVKPSNVGLCGSQAKLLNGNGAGSAGYIAPEVLEGCPHTASSEVFSFGTLLLVMLTGLHATPRPPEQPECAVDAVQSLLTEGGSSSPTMWPSSSSRAADTDTDTAKGRGGVKACWNSSSPWRCAACRTRRGCGLAWGRCCVPSVAPWTCTATSLRLPSCGPN